MINNTKIAKFGFAALAALALCACGTKPTSSAPASSVAVNSSSPASSTEDYNFSQNETSIAETIYNLQVVGSITGISSWNPTEHVGDEKVHFVHVSKMLYTLSGVPFAVGNEFKFTFNDGWNNDFGWKGYKGNNTTALDEYLTPSDQASVDAGNDSNIKVLKAVTLDFEYHPFYVAEAGLKNKLVVKIHA